MLSIFDFLNQIYISKFLKTLLSFLSFADLEDIKPDSFAQWTALSNSNKVTQLDISEERSTNKKYVNVIFISTCK